VDNLINIVFSLSEREQKSLLERFVKLSEECGELAQEILIAEDASGFQHKKVGVDGISGEAVDVIIVALSIFHKGGGSKRELLEILEKKCEKWRMHQKH
jgi:NTP pyrophosphatase (non-canonical NTP hydrolase)